VTAAAEIPHLAGRAFDNIATEYDGVFTSSLIGRAQRAAVWRKAASVFRSGQRILELNCGTGEDALFFARNGISVLACDASAGMIARARERKAVEAPLASIEFRLLCTEDLATLPRTQPFDGVFSNFSGLNCVQDLSHTARQLAEVVVPGAALLIGLSTRYCLWEMLHYLLRGELRRSFRRCSGTADVNLKDCSFRVYYPTVRAVVSQFSPMFCLRSITGIGIAVPPSYMEPWAQRRPWMLRACEATDRVVSQWPGIRILGDHMLLHLERVA
jgi:ubiquinone/menaquinone biosynthesis C-methylase UbiE